MKHQSAAVLLALATACLVAPSSGRAADTALAKCGKSIPWSRFAPDDLGYKVVKYDATGMRRIPPAPPPGVHPRIHIGPGELGDLRRRLKETRCGRPHGDSGRVAVFGSGAQDLQRDT